MQDLYTTLPATLRGNALESHTDWPRTWSTSDTDHAMQVAVALRHVIAVGGVPITTDIVCTDNGVTITLDREFA